MAVYLLDTTVIIDCLNNKRRRNEFLGGLLERRNLLACCSINVTEVYAGMRSHESQRTEAFLRSLRFYEVTWEIAQLAGELKNAWSRRGHNLFLPDVTVAAVALAHGLALVTDNRRDFPMPELQFVSLPGG